MSNKNILITRSKEQSEKLAKSFENKGFKVLFEPLFSIKKIDVRKKLSAQEFSEFSAIVVTSANACDAVILVSSELPRNVTIFSVGKKTAEKLFKAGFENILIAPQESAISLQETILKTCDKKTDKILYFHGSVTSLDFEIELKKQGFYFKKILSYQTQEIINFSAELLRFSHTKSFDRVLIFSQNSAEIFLEMAKRHNLLEYFGSAQISCLSKKIREKFLEISVSLDQKNSFKNVATFDEFPILKKFYERH